MSAVSKRLSPLRGLKRGRNQETYIQSIVSKRLSPLREGKTR
jgi:hypothetical protein